MSTIGSLVHQKEERLNTLENLGRLVLKKRGNRGVREVAREIGISHATLSRVERGHLPDLENYQKICKWMGVDISAVTGATPTTPQLPVARVHFRKAPTVSPKTAQALAQMILAAQAMLTTK
jgi:transcriptional regulator with XRE-family HTH domain